MGVTDSRHANQRKIFLIYFNKSITAFPDKTASSPITGSPHPAKLSGIAYPAIDTELLRQKLN